MDVKAKGAACDFSDETASDSLEQYQDVDGDADSMMRVSQVPWRAHGDEAEDEYDCCEANGQNLEVRMILDRLSWALSVEPYEQDGEWHDKEKGDGSQHTVTENEAVVLRKSCEAIAHA